MVLSIPDIIRKKRDKLELTTEEIEFFVRSAVDKTMHDSQIGAMLMVIYLHGLDLRETMDLTRAMIESGDKLRLDKSWSDLLVDKHSTGGVGDKISLVLAPALAACGLKVPMVSGRGLEYTGGTLDKLESIPGFQVKLTQEQMNTCLKEVGCFIAGATSALAPADGVLYNHRDITTTVKSDPLITSSILSKKAAEGTRALVMDLKVGRAAFLKNRAEATRLAEIMVKVGQRLNLQMKCVISQMDVPIGQYVGNALEVVEAIECLQNRGSKDVTDLVKVLGGVLLVLKGLATDVEEGGKKIEETLRNKSALKKFQNMIILQGVAQNVAVEVCNGDAWTVLPRAKNCTSVVSLESGTIIDINAMDIAKCCWHLGAGRSKVGDPINYGVGVRLLKSVGEELKRGENWILVYHDEDILRGDIRSSIEGSLVVSSNQSSEIKKSRIIDIL